MKVFELPTTNDRQPHSQQVFIDRAEEDFLCALSMWRRGRCSHLPITNICYLLHQCIEKWLKAFLAINSLEIPKKYQRTHSLGKFLEIAKQRESLFAELRQKIADKEPKLLEASFPGNLRYSETPEEIEDYVKLLLCIVIDVRRIAKNNFRKVLFQQNEGFVISEIHQEAPT